MRPSLYLVYPDHAESGTLETLPQTVGLELISEEVFLQQYHNLPSSSKICITSEATLDSILKSSDDKQKIDAVNAMKDKFLFRQLLKDIYPEMAFDHISFDEIEHLKLSGKKILKPVKGCFGTAVKTIDENTDLKKVSMEIKEEIGKNSSVLSESVLSQTEFILEDYIEGDEYAVDMFYDSSGRPHIVNIYYHPIPKHEEYLHMVYYTNKSIFDRIYERAIDFLEQLNSKLNLYNIALHSEFKLSENLTPIEINAMRFGGMGLGNMVYHSVNINPYQCFIEEQSPNWNEIWAQHPNSNYVYFIAYNGTKIDVEYKQPDVPKLEHHFSKIINRTLFDYKKQLAFGVYTLEENLEKVNRFLEIDFNEYFKDID